MGRGRNRKPRNFATFRLCPRPGAADASDRVFVRVDDNPYYIPGFADDDDVDNDDSSSAAAAAAGLHDEDDDRSPSSPAGGELPEHVRREIVELGLPDDGYNYLSHIREIRPSFSSSGGGGSSAAFLPARRCPRPARFGPPLDVKAYDARPDVGVGPDEVVAVTRVEEAIIDADVAALLEEGDVLPPADPEEDEGFEEDFIIVADQPEEEEEMDLEEDFVILANQIQIDVEGLQDAWSKDGVPRLPDEQVRMVWKAVMGGGTQKVWKAVTGSSSVRLV
ncbi:uncharacterized protein LOC100828059 [Brachypodium distachyon]|uniref:Uncharacterized protein n=1 Tax=Brachypodium distachyon TaxID=15368 RepID=I1GRY9_BRADI|nr:uncharacterized protein LOC100828059 [Brachypodium distachyon]XP_010235071.3 uncharacterized protein LOC100828059 [Brachypodium distachyon]KQK15041.1 hypothetical protein BRADI_1g20290v3 [Brachypodium distachyon]|eukprot:XP_003562614.3 uncharacterized protein LOC100828059 [Brachypodium distachyon]